MRQIQTVLTFLFLMMICTNSLTAQLTEREQKIKKIYDAKIEQIITNCSANSIIKDEINSNLSDSLLVVKKDLRFTSELLKQTESSKNRLSTFLIIGIILIVGLVIVVYKLITNKK